MNRILISLFIFFTASVHAQESLPNITVNSFNGKVVVSWLNDYDKTVTDIFIQRSFDSARNFTTIGSVLIPRNKENGYPDNTPPYDHMYYRVSIVFEDGSYALGHPTKPSRFISDLPEINVTDTLLKKTAGAIVGLDFSLLKTKETGMISKEEEIKVKKVEQVFSPETLLKNTASMVMMNRYNQLNIQVPDTGIHTYMMKIFDENDQLVFEIKKMVLSGFVLEKYNFKKSGNYSFEIYEDGKLWRKNRFVISREARK
jgi:hypothetical protein